MSLNLIYADFIKRHRIASGYKRQAHLSKVSGITPPTLSRIERGLQKPEVETLKILSQYLKTTSYVELMVVCGYWDKDELLEEIDMNPQPQKGIIEYNKQKNSHSYVNEQELLQSIDLDLSDQELIDKFNINIDGQKLTETEAQIILASIRSIRQVQNKG